MRVLVNTCNSGNTFELIGLTESSPVTIRHGTEVEAREGGVL